MAWKDPGNRARYDVRSLLLQYVQGVRTRIVDKYGVASLARHNLGAMIDSGRAAVRDTMR